MAKHTHQPHDTAVRSLIQQLPAEEKAKLKAHLDGWQNILTGLGLSRDKRKSGSFVPESLSFGQAEEIWKGNDLGAKIVTKVPKEMTRRGFDVHIQGEDSGRSKADEESVENKLQDLESDSRLYDALCFERAYGGGAVFLGVDDGEKDLRNPLNPNRLQDIKFLTAIPAQELFATAWYDNPFAPRYGMPSRYRFQPQGAMTARAFINQEVHESRFLLFPGTIVSRRQLLANQGWGSSVLLRVHEVLSDFGQTWGSVAALLQDFAQAVYKIKGLSNLVAQNKDTEVMKRVQIIDLMRSIIRGVLLDADEEYKRETTPLSGIPEILEQFALRLSAAADMPVSLLMGQAPAGLNATGASDIRFFYDDVAGDQKTKLGPQAKRLIKLICLSKKGPTQGRLEKRWSLSFRPLWQMTEQEEAELRNKQADTDSKYIQSGVVTPTEIAVSRFGGDAYSTETSIDIAGRKEPETEQVGNSQPEENADKADTPRRGVYIALWPPKDIADSIALPGQEPSEQLHLTLAYLGKVSEFEPHQFETIRRVVKEVSSGWYVRASISGVGVFSSAPSSDGLAVLYASVDSPALPEKRAALVKALEANGILVGTLHGFTPHITLAYQLSPSFVALPPLGGFSFPELRILIGEETFILPLEGGGE